MKIFRILALIAIVLSVSCKGGQNNQTDHAATPAPEVTTQAQEAEAAPTENTKYNPNDARTFGLVGPVQEVRYSKALLSTTSPEEQGDPWLESDELELTFDEYGRVTLDGLRGCKYVYDENGNENPDASRRVEFKFSLKDAEMIEEMNRILSEQGQ